MRRIKTKSLLQSETGMTLIELVVVIVIIGILSVIFAPYFRVNILTYSNVMKQKEAIQTTRIGMRRMVSELKRIPSPEDLDSGSSTQIQFDLPGESNVRYTYDNSNMVIMRRTGRWGSDDVFLAGVQAFSLSYIERDGSVFNSISQGSNVASIQIDLTVGDGAYNYTTRTLVSPRGLH